MGNQWNIIGISTNQMDLNGSNSISIFQVAGGYLGIGVTQCICGTLGLWPGHLDPEPMAGTGLGWRRTPWQVEGSPVFDEVPCFKRVRYAKSEFLRGQSCINGPLPVHSILKWFVSFYQGVQDDQDAQGLGFSQSEWTSSNPMPQPEYHFARVQNGEIRELLGVDPHGHAVTCRWLTTNPLVLNDVSNLQNILESAKPR